MTKLELEQELKSTKMKLARREEQLEKARAKIEEVSNKKYVYLYTAVEFSTVYAEQLMKRTQLLRTIILSFSNKQIKTEVRKFPDGNEVKLSYERQDDKAEWSFRDAVFLRLVSEK